MSYASQQPHEASIPILQMEKLKNLEVKSLAQLHTIEGIGGRDENRIQISWIPVLGLDQKPILLPTDETCPGLSIQSV